MAEERDGEPATGPARRSLLGPTGLTLLLTAALAGSGAALLLRAPGAALLPPPSGASRAVVVAVLVVAFFLTELGQALVEVRRQAYSFSLSGIPLLLGLLYCPPDDLVAVRLLAAVTAFAVQRATLLKGAFNTASYLVDSALVIIGVHQLTGGDPALSLATAARCYLGMAAVDLVMSCVVLLVIRINSGPVSVQDAVEVLAPASVFVLLNTATGFVVALFLGGGALGGALLGVFVLTTAVVYRGYLVLRRRHRSLQLVHDFVELTTGTVQGADRDADGLAVVLLQHIRTVLRASRVELVLAEAGGTRTAVAVTEDAASSRVDGRRHTDAFLATVLDQGRATVLDHRSTDDAARSWLAASGAQDALVVALPAAGTPGLVVATDRIGDATAFTRDDLALLQTLAGHLAVALRSAQLVRQLRHEATHDVLTGLPNRALLTERMGAALDGPVERRSAVLLMDLNRFKEVNDALGHHVGDELLQVVAARVQALPLPGSTVARLGGDEFAVLLAASATAEADALHAAELVTVALGAPVDLAEATVATGASIGIAVAAPASSVADLLRHADTAMYAAKEAGEHVVVYTEALDHGRAERLALLADLHLALDADELELHYQPKLDLTFGVITGVEALVRWTHPRLGLLLPDAFVPLAESTGLIESFTRHLLAKALRQCRAWLDDGVDLSVAVNLSARNVNDPALPEHVAAALVHAGVPAHRLVLEITESSVMGDPDHTVPILRRLAAIGVTLSLDDFGTGYSSLSYLQRLPVRELKIDRSFITGLAAEAATGGAGTSAALIRSITGLKDSLGLRVVAEGVEDAGTLEQLRDLGCDLVQGYHVSRPAPASRLDTSRCARLVRGADHGAGHGTGHGTELERADRA